jgi:hypothetical protein
MELKRPSGPQWTLRRSVTTGHSLPVDTACCLLLLLVSDSRLLPAWQ